VRAYGIPERDSTVYVELKKKFKGVVYKRRAGMKLHEAESFLAGGEPPGERTQIINEIAWVRDFYDLSPHVYIAYDRIALECPENPRLRVTFDSNVRARSHDLSLALGDHGQPLLPEGYRLMEIKAPGAVPMWLCDLLSELKIYPSRFSKYGTYYQQLIEENLNQPKEKENCHV